MMLHEKGAVLIEAFSDLVSDCDELSCVIAQTQPAIWVPDQNNEEGSSGVMVSEHVKNIWYDDDQKGPETRRLPGIVVANKSVHDAVAQVNDAKQAFFNAMNLVMEDVPQRRVSELRALLDGWNGHRMDEVADALRRLGANRINLLQAYRKFVHLQSPVKSVSFTWNAKAHSTVKMTADEVVELIDDRVLDRNKAEYYIDLVTRTREIEFAISRTLRPNLKANVLFEDKTRTCVVAHSPLFIETSDGNLPKTIRWKTLEELQDRRVRRESAKLWPEPIVAELNIYAYR